MSGKSTRKGKTGELEVMHILREHGYHVDRGGAQSFGERPDLFGMKDVHLEIKRCETTKIWEWMEQSKADAARFGDGWPTVIFRRSRSNWLICMELENWLQLYQKAQECRCGGHCQGRHEAAETGEKAQK